MSIRNRKRRKQEMSRRNKKRRNQEMGKRPTTYQNQLQFTDKIKAFALVVVAASARYRSHLSHFTITDTSA